MRARDDRKFICRPTFEHDYARARRWLCCTAASILMPVIFQYNGDVDEGGPQTEADASFASRTRCSCHSATRRQSTRSEWALHLESWATNWERGKAWTSRKSVATAKESSGGFQSATMNRSKIICWEQGIDGRGRATNVGSPPYAAGSQGTTCRRKKSLQRQPRELELHRITNGHQSGPASSHRRANMGNTRCRSREYASERAVTWARDHVFERSVLCQGAPVRFSETH